MCRTVENVMTRDVACTREDTPYKELVELLATRRVSAVPVVDDRGHVLGVVSGADLLLKQEQPAITVGTKATLTEAARRLHAVGSSGWTSSSATCS